MRKGKLQQSMLVRSVFKMLGQKREDAAGPAVGRGVSAFAGEKETAKRHTLWVCVFGLSFSYGFAAEGPRRRQNGGKYV